MLEGTKTSRIRACLQAGAVVLSGMNTALSRAVAVERQRFFGWPFEVVANW